MSHTQQHNRLRGLLERVLSTYDPIFNRHHNGNKPVNNELQAHLKALYGYRDAFEMHDESTAGDDDKLSKYRDIKRQRNIAYGLFLAIVPSLITFILMKL